MTFKSVDTVINPDENVPNPTNGVCKFLRIIWSSNTVIVEL